MKAKIFLFILLFVLVAPLAVGQTMTEAQRQALIAQIQAQIAALQNQINQGNIQGVVTTWCYTFNTNLGFASSGTNEVSELHTVLQKENIPYSLDTTITYSTATAEAVKKFQAKYGILQTGYVGPLTRAKINQLYGCVSVTNCMSNWQTGNWGACTNGQQTRTVTDSNNCGSTVNKPAVTQTCTVKPIDIRANGSDGPVNLFLTKNNGAIVNSSGIALSKSIELKWTGSEVSSCSASDSAKQSVFSGFKPASGSQTVTLSGTIQPSSSSSSKVSSTFRINCVSTSSGANANDSVTVNLFYTVNSNCTPTWQCTSWSACSGNRQTRTCTDSNGCGSLEGKSAESQSCTLPPTVNIKANYSEGPVSLPVGNSVNLSWTSTNVTSCTASGGWSGTKGANSSERISTLTSSATYTITCVNSAGAQAIDSVTVNITSS